MAHAAAALADVEAEAHAVPAPALALTEALAAAVLVVRHAQRRCHRREATKTTASAGIRTEPPGLFVEKLRQLLTKFVSLLKMTGRCWPCRTSICYCCWLGLGLEERH